LSIASNIINIVVLIIQRYSFITTLFLGPFDDVITKFYSIFISALDGGEWSVSRTGRLTSGGRVPDTHWIGGWVGPSAGLDAVV
jgi:hypothetical protein